MCFVFGITGKIASNNLVKPFACSLPGRSAFRACPGMASPLLREQVLHAEVPYPGAMRFDCVAQHATLL